MKLDRRSQLLPLCEHRADKAVKGLRIDQSGDPGQRFDERCGGCLQQALPNGLLQFQRVTLVDQVEMRRQSRLDRKTAQQGLAKAVDGRDRHAARRVEDACKQASGGRQLFLGRGFPGQLGQGLDQGSLPHGRPAGEHGIDALGHVRGGGTGEGEAQDAVGRGAGQHQAQDPVRQHLGLARTGGSADPDGSARVRCQALAIGGHADRIDGGCHVSPAAAPADHSLTRARWS